MSFDFRLTEKVSVMGIPITTFLDDTRSFIWISVTDLVSQLGLIADPEDWELEEHELSDATGRLHSHLCMDADKVTDFLYSCAVSSDRNTDNLEDFRRDFYREVMNFWERFAPAAASCSIREAYLVVDQKATFFLNRMGIKEGRALEYIYDALGFDVVPLKDELTVEEYGYVSHSLVLYASLVNEAIERGYEDGDACYQAEKELAEALPALARVTRGLAQC
jgi:hypothetical protein